MWGHGSEPQEDAMMLSRFKICKKRAIRTAKLKECGMWMQVKATTIMATTTLHKAKVLDNHCAPFLWQCHMTTICQYKLMNTWIYISKRSLLSFDFNLLLIMT